MTTTKPDILTLAYHVDKDGVTHFRCRGIGRTYHNFYQWVYSLSYVCEEPNWPWDYFHFTDETDAKQVLETYDVNCYEDNPDTDYEN